MLAESAATAQPFKDRSGEHLFIPYANLDLPIGHWKPRMVCFTIFFPDRGPRTGKQGLTTGSLANPKAAAAVPMLCAVGGMIAPAILF